MSANDPQFSSYKLPPLFDLKITTTGLALAKRKKLQEDVEENGGVFNDTFNVEDTDILIIDKYDSTNSKINSAHAKKIPCLKSTWIEDSVKTGYALPYETYTAKRARVKSNENLGNNTNNRRSNNTSFDTSKSEIEINDNTITLRDPLASKTNMISDAEANNDDLPDFCNIERAKKMENIFDGYSFYFHGFSFDLLSKLSKIITVAGGTKIADLNEHVTHVISFENHMDIQTRIHERKLTSCVVLKFAWLLDCFNDGKLKCENDYTIENALVHGNKLIPPSPLSKKAISTMNVSSSSSSLCVLPVTSKLKEKFSCKELYLNDYRKIKPAYSLLGSKKRKSDEETDSQICHKRQKQ
jgi:hypothetical protein